METKHIFSAYLPILKNSPLFRGLSGGEILLLHVQKLLSVCSSACSHHTRLIQNLVTILAGKILVFNNKLTHLSKRSTKEKLLSYLSEESIRQGSLSFSIPFDRQQLADYLCVERAALSVVISKLQKEGVLSAEKNHFTLICNEKSPFRKETDFSFTTIPVLK